MSEKVKIKGGLEAFRRATSKVEDYDKLLLYHNHPDKVRIRRIPNETDSEKIVELFDELENEYHIPVVDYKIVTRQAVNEHKESYIIASKLPGENVEDLLDFSIYKKKSSEEIERIYDHQTSDRYKKFRVEFAGLCLNVAKYLIDKYCKKESFLHDIALKRQYVYDSESTKPQITLIDLDPYIIGPDNKEYERKVLHTLCSLAVMIGEYKHLKDFHWEPIREEFIKLFSEQPDFGSTSYGKIIKKHLEIK